MKMELTKKFHKISGADAIIKTVSYGYGLNDRGSIPGRERLLFHHHVQTYSRVKPIST
jgi:hypothetical protein